MPVKTHDPTRNRELANFIETASQDQMPFNQTMWVLENVIASPKDVCDLWVGNERMAVGLLASLANETEHKFELTLMPLSDKPILTSRVLEWVQSRLNGRPWNQIEVPLWKGCLVNVPILKSHGFSPHHKIYEMEAMKENISASTSKHPLKANPAGWHWQPISEPYMKKTHQTARLAFEGIPGAFVPDFTNFRRLQQSHSPPTHILIDDQDDVAGFVRVKEVRSAVAEISVLGRHPKHRGKGLGELLLNQAITLIQPLRSDYILLEVASTNTEAMQLYSYFGFGVSSEIEVFAKTNTPA